MIAIPIFLFVMLIIFSTLFIAFIVVAIVSYVTYCRWQDKEVENNIKKLERDE